LENQKGYLFSDRPGMEGSESCVTSAPDSSQTGSIGDAQSLIKN